MLRRGRLVGWWVGATKDDRYTKVYTKYEGV